MKYVVLGSGIAGMAAANAIRENDSAAKILMISAEQELCFNRPMIVDEFALDGSGAALFEKEQEWPMQQGVEVCLGSRVEEIDREAKALRLADGTREYYDKLIYTLGTKPAVPAIPGIHRENVFTIRTREDMKQIRAAMRNAKHAVVIGGGLLGLEEAWALKKEKLEVAVIEQNQRVAFDQIDQSAGNLMKKRIERMGVPVYVDASVKEIGDGYVLFRQKSTGIAEIDDVLITVSADMVIVSTGVTPNSALGEAAGLAVTGNDEHWISVDEHCRTSDPDIYAAGDVAAVDGRNEVIWDAARESGRVAGVNAAGGDVVYQPIVAKHVFHGFDTELFTLADSSGAETDGVYMRHADVELIDYLRERYVRISLQNGIIAGVLLINAPELAPELMEAYENRAGEDEARSIIQQWKDKYWLYFESFESLKIPEISLDDDEKKTA